MKARLTFLYGISLLLIALLQSRSKKPIVR